MKPIVIPFSAREPYVRQATTERVEDSRGMGQIIWPCTLDLPTELHLRVEGAAVGSVECRYPRDLGGTADYAVMDGRGRFRLHHDRRVLASFGLVPPMPLGEGAYDRFADLLGRIRDVVCGQSDREPFKWLTIFSVGIVHREWLRMEWPIRHLLSSPSSPFR